MSVATAGPKIVFYYAYRSPSTYTCRPSLISFQENSACGVPANLNRKDLTLLTNDESAVIANYDADRRHAMPACRHTEHGSSLRRYITSTTADQVCRLKSAGKKKKSTIVPGGPCVCCISLGSFKTHAPWLLGLRSTETKGKGNSGPHLPKLAGQTRRFLCYCCAWGHTSF